MNAIADAANDAIDLGYLAQASARADFAEKVLKVLRQESPGRPQAFDPLARVLGDVPQLVELAKRGLLDRALIQQQAGLRERAAAVRTLHDLTELPGTGPICAHCSELARRPVAWPCPTTDRNDGNP